MPNLNCPKCQGEIFFSPSYAKTRCKHCGYLVVIAPDIIRERTLANMANQAFKNSLSIKEAKAKKEENEKFFEPIWFYSNDFETHTGPISISDIAQKLEQGAIKEDALIWSTKIEDWQPVLEVIHKIGGRDIEPDQSYQGLNDQVKSQITPEILDNPNQNINIRHELHEDSSLGLIQVSEYSQKFDIPIDNLISMIHDGDLPGEKRGNTWYVENKEIIGLDEKYYQNIASDIVLAARKYRVEAPTSGDEKSADAGAEIIYLLLHVLDRQAFNDLSDSRRDKVFDKVSVIAISDYVKSVIKKDATSDFKDNLTTQMMHTLDERQLIYAQCNSITGDFPNSGTMVFVLGFYIHKALGKTDRNDVDEILVGKGNLSDADIKDFPDPVELVDLSVKVTVAITESQIAENLKHLK